MAGDLVFNTEGCLLQLSSVGLFWGLKISAWINHSNQGLRQDLNSKAGPHVIHIRRYLYDVLLSSFY